MKTINFEALFSASPNPYVLLDLSLTIVGMNDAYLQVTMRKREDLLGRNMFEAFPSDPDSSSHRQLRGSLEKVIREQVADHLSLIEYAIPLPNGQGFEERYWSATHTPLFNHNGEITFILQHTVDVTELHRLRNLAKSTLLPSGRSALIETDMFRRAQAVQEANQALSEERQHLRGLFQQAPGFMAALSGPDHVFTMANTAYLQLIGRENVVGRPVREALPEVVGQGFIDLLDRVRHSGQPFVGRSIRILLKQSPEDVQEERFLDFVYQPIFDPDGQVSGIFVQGHDVTEQRRTEEALRESEERFRAIANSIDQLIWATQPDGYHDYYNQRWYEYTGVPEGSTDGEAWNGMFHPEDQERAWSVWRDCLATGEPYHIDYRLRHRSGEYRWVLGRAQPVRDEEGRIKRWFGTCTDIHDLRQAQDALRESRERAMRTEEETRRLASILAERITELDVANEEIQRFAYIVSHDLRAPLVNVMGFTSELEGAQAEIERFYRNVQQADSTLISPETRAAIESDLPEAIGFIRSSTMKMDKLIGAILKLSREGRRVLAPEPIDMVQLLESQRGSVAHQLQERGAELLIEAVPDLTSDRLAVEQIFGNLVDNAVKYLHPSRPGRIEVRGRALGANVVYEVEDNGRGIDPKDFERIFDLFRRSGAQDQQGEGIGLAHVRALVRRLGGTISVSSRLGEGSTFTVVLPSYISMNSEAA
ncbi:PAS domain-containing protein [Microvirga sp. 3-52]|uniref:PAS domain-containing sensor histidine kinase n=1 Tax=Microvirga sp. 3-52 TaxID=2792425 RepID=UPI001ACD0BE3|nr:PAS domain-containing protein [Microvirga sp. 3-52]MBO1904842.1 PAS domain-containing protein [Microvirga sp. 3-52]MBS7452366.1 PAS domain-containing protein [Microvirga sp. 3-52]